MTSDEDSEDEKLKANSPENSPIMKSMIKPGKATNHLDVF